MDNFIIKIISTIAIVFVLAILLGFLELVFPPLSFALATLFEIVMGAICIGAIVFVVHIYRRNATK